MLLVKGTAKVKGIKTYSGYKDSERPLSFSISEKEIKVSRILSTRLEELPGSKRKRRQVFKILGDDGQIYFLIHYADTPEWFVET